MGDLYIGEGTLITGYVSITDIEHEYGLVGIPILNQAATWKKNRNRQELLHRYGRTHTGRYHFGRWVHSGSQRSRARCPPAQLSPCRRTCAGSQTLRRETGFGAVLTMPACLLSMLEES